MKKLTQQDFITKAIEKHGNRYSYTKAVYVNKRTPLVITCKSHGDFIQSPDHHINGAGCPKCKNAHLSKLQTKDVNYFKKLFDSKFFSKISFVPANYLGMTTNMQFTCKDHGIFELSPAKLLTNVKGCPKCGHKERKQSPRTAINQLLSTLEEIHNNRYDYSKIQFTKMKNPHVIICKEHGEFLQSLTAHKAGRGCPSCAIAGFNPKKPAILYYLSINNGQAYKIGITNKSIEERFTIKELKTIKVIKTWEYSDGYECRAQEQKILKDNKNYKYKGVNLLEHGNSELFYYDILNLDTEV